MVSTNGYPRQTFRLAQPEVTVQRYRPIPGTFVPSVPKKKIVEFSLCKMLCEEGWSLSQVDEAVRRGLIELFFKAGRSFVRIL
jgi:hypothetical protein